MKSGRKAEGQALIDKFESQQEAEKVKEQNRPRIKAAQRSVQPKGEMMNVATRLKSPAIFLVSIIAYFSFLACPARAQFNSGFTGIVVEQSEAAVGGAKVVVINQDTQVSRYAITSDSGDFRIASLPGGIYTIQVDAQGFKQWEQKGVVLESNEVKTLHPILGLSTQTTTVEVSGAVSAVETDKSDTSREISEQTIETAPCSEECLYEHDPARTWHYRFRSSQRGALGSGSANNDSFEQEAGYQINAAGQRQENNEYDVDGSGLNSASRDGVVNLSPEPDFINQSVSRARLSTRRRAAIAGLRCKYSPSPAQTTSTARFRNILPITNSPHVPYFNTARPTSRLPRHSRVPSQRIRWNIRRTDHLKQAVFLYRSVWSSLVKRVHRRHRC